jgi:SAM-dependent methyltransferase
MSASVHFPLTYPGDVRPLLAEGADLRRLVKLAELQPRSAVLVLGVTSPERLALLAQEVGLQLTVADPSAERLERLQASPVLEAWAGQLTFQQVGVEGLTAPGGGYAAIIVDLIPPMSLTDAVSSLRPLLGRDGKLLLGYPVRVGRHAHPSALRFWEQKLGEPLLLPRECLQVLERSGFEPLFIEALEDGALDAFYRQVEEALEASGEPSPQLREELTLHRGQGGRACSTFAVMIGRRREPGEKPPSSRHG